MGKTKAIRLIAALILSNCVLLEAAGVCGIDPGRTIPEKRTAVLSFTDITAQALGNTGPGTHSAVFADATGDGKPDLYTTRLLDDVITDLFFKNVEGTAFTEEGALRSVDDPDGGSHGAVFADFDNDGDFDLFNGSSYNSDNATPAHNNLFINDGLGFFTDIADSASPFAAREEPTRGVAAFDMDNDGDLDIFAVSDYAGSGDPPDQRNEVYRNDGGLVFTAVVEGDLYTAAAGQGCTDTDFDNDGDVDIFAGNRTGDVNILVNDGSGNFLLVPPSEIMDIVHKAGDGITIGDIDNDGDLDLLLVTEGPPSEAHLYRNVGNGTFAVIQSWSGVSGYMGGFADLDNDGDVDLAFAGHPVIYLNDGAGVFASGPAVPVNGAVDPRAVGFADIDGDGDLDMAVGDKRFKGRMFRNDLDSDNHWLKVRLVSPDGQAGAFGAKVSVIVPEWGTNRLIGFREARSAFGYSGQDDPVLHFGLGADSVVSVVVEFSGGSRAIRTFVKADTVLDIIGADAFLSVRVVLEGFWDQGAGCMRTVLGDSGLVPLTSPYPEDPRAAIHVPQNMVDWVLVELLNPADGTVRAAKSCWLDRDGALWDLAGIRPEISFDISEGDYWVLVRHRSHLFWLSSGAFFFRDGLRVVWDPETDPESVWEACAAVGLGSGRWGLAAGNTDASDDDILASDLAFILTNGSDCREYADADVNGDGLVDEADYDLARKNMLLGLFSRIPGWGGP